MTGIEAIIIPIVNIVTGMFKAYGINSKLLPAVALVVGTAVGYSMQPDLTGAVEGAVAALAAMGLYSANKTQSK